LAAYWRKANVEFGPSLLKMATI